MNEHNHYFLQVEKWPKEDYGKFYSGDSYIILNTYKDEEDEVNTFLKFLFYLHGSTNDEYRIKIYMRGYRGYTKFQEESENDTENQLIMKYDKRFKTRQLSSHKYVLAPPEILHTLSIRL